MSVGRSLTVALLPDPPRTGGDVAVVIDVLRMTTTATVLGERGVAELEVVADVAPARERARATGALLLGEREARPPPGFDGGNSPLEHLGRELAGRRALLCTSNGSRAVEGYHRTPHLLLGAIRNAAAVAARALELAETGVVLACAGTGGRVSLDDALGAACIAEELLTLDPALAPCDETRIALALLQGAPVAERLREASHARTLIAQGFEGDVRFAGCRNASSVVLERASESTSLFRPVLGRPSSRRARPASSAP